MIVVIRVNSRTMDLSGKEWRRLNLKILFLLILKFFSSFDMNQVKYILLINCCLFEKKEERNREFRSGIRIYSNLNVVDR
jgi:hypothetical protein